MSNNLADVKGFDVLTKQIKSLPDKVKRKEVLKILGQVANPTVKVAKQLAPVNDGFIQIKRFRNEKYRRKGYVPGTGRKSIGKKTMRRAKNPTLYVSPRSTKKADGWYLRQFVIKGTKNQKANAFIDRAYNQTKGQVAADGEQRIAKYIQKQINRLS